MTQLIDAGADLLTTTVDYVRQEAEGITREKIAKPLQDAGVVVGAMSAAAILLVLGIIFIAVAGHHLAVVPRRPAARVPASSGRVLLVGSARLPLREVPTDAEERRGARALAGASQRRQARAAAARPREKDPMMASKTPQPGEPAVLTGPAQQRISAEGVTVEDIKRRAERVRAGGRRGRPEDRRGPLRENSTDPDRRGRGRGGGRPVASRTSWAARPPSAWPSPGARRAAARRGSARSRPRHRTAAAALRLQPLSVTQGDRLRGPPRRGRARGRPPAHERLAAGCATPRSGAAPSLAGHVCDNDASRPSSRRWRTRRCRTSSSTSPWT